MKGSRRAAGSRMRSVAVYALALALPAWPGASHAKTHPGRVALVTVSAPGVDECGSFWTNRVLAQVAPDGSVANQEYVVPPGYELVVTDLDWTTTESPSNFSQGTVQYFDVVLGAPPHPAVFQAATTIDADLAAAGTTRGNAALTTGFRVGPGVVICPSASTNTSYNSGANTVTSLAVRGYLVKAK